MHSFVGDAGDLELCAQADGKPMNKMKLFQEGRRVGGLSVAAAGD